MSRSILQAGATARSTPPANGNAIARPNSSAKRPLDDGPRDGTETWRVIAGVPFCHWDRWLLRLALAQREGLDAIARTFRIRSRNRASGSDLDEAMLAQVVDLRGRLAAVGQSPATLLDDDERASDWLFRKASKRVWESGPHRRTAAMRATPRRVLAARALRGHWPGFPISPELYEREIRRDALLDLCLGGSAAGAVADLVELRVGFLARAPACAEQRFAVYRAAMTVAIDAMECVSDSLAEVAYAYEGIERAYLELLPSFIGDDAVLRDLLELAIWEDYGLTRGVEPFLRRLGEPDADRGLAMMAGIIAELRRHDLEHALGRARTLRSAIVASAESLWDH